MTPIEQLFDVTTQSSEFRAGFDTAIQRVIAYLDDESTSEYSVECSMEIEEFLNRKVKS